jgi:hypothetical protein
MLHLQVQFSSSLAALHLSLSIKHKRWLDPHAFVHVLNPCVCCSGVAFLFPCRPLEKRGHCLIGVDFAMLDAIERCHNLLPFHAFSELEKTLVTP